jgi:hypothetical protein
MMNAIFMGLPYRVTGEEGGAVVLESNDGKRMVRVDYGAVSLIVDPTDDEYFSAVEHERRLIAAKDRANSSILETISGLRPLDEAMKKADFTAHMRKLVLEAVRDYAQNKGLLSTLEDTLTFVREYIKAGQMRGAPKDFPAPYAIETRLEDAIAQLRGRSYERV